VVRPIAAVARVVSASFDTGLVDGAVNGIASLAARAGSHLRRLQTGHVPTYVLSILVGAVVLLGYLAFRG
jgi:NADH-quinone oxidoreductase subunit L